jgi:hypothetical protein
VLYVLVCATKAQSMFYYFSPLTPGNELESFVYHCQVNVISHASAKPPKFAPILQAPGAMDTFMDHFSDLITNFLITLP